MKFGLAVILAGLAMACATPTATPAPTAPPTATLEQRLPFCERWAEFYFGEFTDETADFLAFATTQEVLDAMGAQVDWYQDDEARTRLHQWFIQRLDGYCLAVLEHQP